MFSALLSVLSAGLFIDAYGPNEFVLGIQVFIVFKRAPGLDCFFTLRPRLSEVIAIRNNDLHFTSDGALTGMIRKSKIDQFGKGRLVFGS